VAVQQLGRKTAEEMFGPLSELKADKAEEALAKMFAGEVGFYENPALDESFSPDPVKPSGPLAKPEIDLGDSFKSDYHVLNIKERPKINPDNNRNTGYGPKGNIFPSSAAQRAEYDRVYGGTGSENALAMQKLREMGEEGLVARRARERYENSPAGRKPQPQKTYSSFSEFFGK